jgi:isochorismate synthase
MIIDTAITIPEHRLHARFAAGLQQAQRSGRPTLVSTVLHAPQCDPLDFFARGASLADERFFWSNPGAEYAIAGVDAAWTLALAGASRFAAAATAWRELCANALIDNPSTVPGTGPLLMGGFSFDPLRPSMPLWEGYSDGLLVLPRFVLASADGAAWLTINLVFEPDSPPDAAADLIARVYELFEGDPLSAHLSPVDGIDHGEDVMPAEQWKAIVRQIEQNMRRGELGKVVLARQYHVEGRAVFDPALVAERLRADYADCFVFAVARGERCFLGASPERLVRLRDGAVRATCLAGSIARGATAEQDQQLGAELLASAKDRAEHEFVVRAICAALADICADQMSAGPLSLMKLRNVQHLFTPIVGRVAVGCDILDVVARLHPTPAMGGVPREQAMEIIRRFEGMDRGWYASPIGWMDARGEGEFAVAIRSALLHGDEATLFAGCGIVAGSDPDREYAESCLKLRPMLAALGSDAITR